MQPGARKYALFRVRVAIFLLPLASSTPLRHSAETTLLKHELMKLQLTSLLRAVKLSHTGYQLKYAPSLSKFYLASCKHKASSTRAAVNSGAKRGEYRFICIARRKRGRVWKERKDRVPRVYSILSFVRKRIESCRWSSCLETSDSHRRDTTARVMRH